ncbi:BatA domain-containing protein [Stieleria sp. JC731]|uniref:BatA domain-containing protein n=1 Tax=Pirellulaceae TaxID=2691357 RepID=UPI001E550C31|nr:BatA domain-containing protein [Stieleria sp. JC731]MCC9599724.1 BatA domain-containing protein [Stieleria sp. JC731]
MSFLRLEALWALPLVLAPLIIHLLHRRRHPTVAWPAMMFLYQATKMRRGPAKLRRWLVLATRVIVVGLIVFALARPLSSGIFGMAAGRIADTGKTIVLIDRSTGMQRRDALGRTRQTRGLESVAETLATLGIENPVVIDSVTLKPIELADLHSLRDGSLAQPADSRAGMAAMVMAAFEYLADQDATLVDLWIVSDRSESTWDPGSPTWQSIRRMSERYGDGLRLHRFDFQENVNEPNSAIHVTDLRWGNDSTSQESAEESSRLLLSVKVDSDQKNETIPVRVAIGNATQEIDLQLSDGQASLDNFPINVAQGSKLYGSVSLPIDCNPADDDWFFTLSPPAKPVIAIVSEQPCDALIAMGEVLGEVAFDIAGGASLADQVGKPVGEGQGGWNLNGTDSLWWQGQLPSGETAKVIEEFCKAGGSVAFFPPTIASPESQFQGVRWGGWSDTEPEETSFSGVKFMVDQTSQIEGEFVAVSTLTDSSVWLAQRQTGRGIYWFCGADVSDHQSMFVRQGLGLFAVLDATLSKVDQQLIRRQEFVAGPEAASRLTRAESDPQLVVASATAGQDLSENQVSSNRERGFHRGVYGIESLDQDRRLIAINRDVASHLALDDPSIEALMPGHRMNVVSIDGSSINETEGVTRELWGALWLTMIVGLLVEGWLSLSSRPVEHRSGTKSFDGRQP